MSDHTEELTEYRYIGPGYLNGVPARDLTVSDILEVYDREGITREQIEASGIYERWMWVEISFAPCGLKQSPTPPRWAGESGQ